MRIDNAEFSGSITGTEATAYLSGSFSGSFHGELIGSIESASYATTASHALTASLLLGSIETASYALTASQITPSNGTASVHGHLIPTDSGSHDLGSIQNPFRDLFVSTSSLNFVRNGVIVSVVNGGDEYIQVGNIIIGTSSISYASGSNGDIQNIIAVDTSSESNMVNFVSPDGEKSSYTGSFSGSFHGDGARVTGIISASHATTAVTTASVNDNTLTFTKGDGTTFNLTVVTSSGGGVGESLSSLNTFTSSIQSEVDALQSATGSYLTSSGSVDFSDVTNKPSLHSGSQQVIDSLPSNTVSGSGYVSSSIAGQVITFRQSDGTTETITVPAGGGGGGESIASLNTFTSSIQSEVDALQSATGSYLTSSGSVDFSDVTNKPSLHSGSQQVIDSLPNNTVSGSGYISSSVNLNTITFTQADGTTESLTVDTGSGGGGGSTDVLEYNNVVRISSGSASQNNYEMVVAGDVYKNISWSRSSTTLTITHNSHGLAVGDVVHIRNMSEDYVSHPIASVTTNTFTVTVANSGGTSGTEGVFVPVPRCTTIDPVGGSIVIANPSAGKCNIQTIKFYYPTVEATVINIDVPAGLDDGFGTNSALGTRFVPLVTHYKLEGANPVLQSTTTITFSKTATHSRFSIAGGNIDTFDAAISMVRF